MLIPPQFWAYAEQTMPEKNGRSYRLRVWGWSNDSLVDAEHQAQVRINQIISRGGPGSGPENWYYPLGPLREELIDTIGDEHRPGALITRSRHGALVLNTDALIIADVDVAVDSGRNIGIIARIFGRKHPPDDGMSAARTRIASFADRHPTLGVRSYRTKAGFRVFITGTNYSPGDSGSTALLNELESDALYVRLCAAQKSFRARLTPKPWRIDIPALTSGWPSDDTLNARERRAWIAEYEKASRQYAVCTLDAAFGPAPTAEEKAIIDFHDRVTQANSDLALA